VPATAGANFFHDLIFKIRRNVADAKPSLRVAIIGMRTNKSLQRCAELSIQRRRSRQRHLPWNRKEIERQDDIAVNLVIVRRKIDARRNAAIAALSRPLLSQSMTQIVISLWVVRF